MSKNFTVSLLFSLLFLFGCISIGQQGGNYQQPVTPSTPTQPSSGALPPKYYKCTMSGEGKSFTLYLSRDKIVQEYTNSDGEHTVVVVDAKTEKTYMKLAEDVKEAVKNKTGKVCEWVAVSQGEAPVPVEDFVGLPIEQVVAQIKMVYPMADCKEVSSIPYEKISNICNYTEVFNVTIEGSYPMSG